MELGPEDQPDAISIGPVHDIPIVDDDDLRFTAEREAWSRARSVAQGAHSPDELLLGLRHQDWMVRHECVDRLIARGREDPRTLPVLLDLARTDPVEDVRSAIAMRLHEFDTSATVRVLRAAGADPSADVRWSAAYALAQLGLGRMPD